MNFLYATLLSYDSVSHLTIENLAVKYSASSAVGGGNLSHFALRNCEISWAGGACIFNTGNLPNPLECERYQF